MPTPVIGENGYPTLQTIMDVVRGLLNDSGAGATGTPGEGQVVTDDPTISPFTKPLLGSCIRETYRELRNAGDPSLILDNYILLNCPIINGPQGSAIPDPAVQCQISPVGFFDGSQIHANLTLPANGFYPERLWERQTGSNTSFQPMHQSQEGLPTGYQGLFNHVWEWRQDGIWLPGTTYPVDIRIRCRIMCPTLISDTTDFTTTQVPLYDCEEAIAYKMACKVGGTMLGAEQFAQLQASALDAMLQLKNAIVRRAQTVTYRRPEYVGGSGRGQR
jgi:hypothetical protein